MNARILSKLMDEGVDIQINDNIKKCMINDIDDFGILVEYYKYDDKDLVYYPFVNILRISIG